MLVVRSGVLQRESTTLSYISEFGDYDSEYPPTLREWSGKTLKDRIDLVFGVVYRNLRDPITRVFLMQMIRDCPERDDWCELNAIFDGYKSRYRYTHDPRDLDLFITIRRQWELGGGSSDGDLSRPGTWTGDCDDATSSLAALCIHAGFEAGAEVIGPGAEPVHIYPFVKFPKNPRRGVEQKLVYMDATVRSSTLGWRPPAKYRNFEKRYLYKEKF